MESVTFVFKRVFNIRGLLAYLPANHSYQRLYHVKLLIRFRNAQNAAFYARTYNTKRMDEDHSQHINLRFVRAGFHVRF